MKYMDIPQLNQLSRLLSYESSECYVHTRIECYSMKPVTKDKRLWKALEKEYSEDQMEVNHALFGKDAPMNRSASYERNRTRSRSVDVTAKADIPRRSSSHHQHSSIGNSPMDPSNLRNQFSPTDDEPEDREVSSSVYRLPGQLDKSERKTLFVLKSTLNAAFPHHDFAVLGADQFSREKNATAVLGSLSNTFRSVGVSSPSIEGGRGLGGGRGGAGTGGRGGSIGALGVTTYSAYPGMFRPSSMPTRSEGFDVLRALERKRGGNGDYDPEIVAATHPVLFGILDDAIGLKKDATEVYVWSPSDLEMDPHHGGGGGGIGDSDESEESSTEEEEDSEEFLEGADTESEEESDEPRRPYFYPGGVSIRKGALTSYDREYGIHKTGSFPTPKELENLHASSGTSTGYPHGTRRFGQTRHSLSPGSRGGNRLRIKGSLLWSNHWFFVNRKQKRVLFISIWAKSRGHGFSPSSNRTGVLKRGLIDRDARGVGHGRGLLGTGDGAGAGATTAAASGAGAGGERFVGWQGAQGAGARAFAARAGSSLF